MAVPNKQKMQNPTLFKSKTNADYFYSASRQGIHLSHPLLNYLLKLRKKGVDIHRWFKETANGNTIEIEDYGVFSSGTIAYYYRKYTLLEENGYFSPVDIKEKLSGRLTAGALETQLANLSQVTFEVTDACNLNCMYCGYGKLYGNYDKRTNKHFDLKTAKTLLQFLKKHWTSPSNISHGTGLHISFYGGEPLLNFPFIKEIIRYTQDLDLPGRYFTYGMTTNGLLLGKYMDFLVANKVQLYISLDGDEENTGYRVFHSGKPAFADIFKNVLTLKKKYPDFFEQSVNFNSVLHAKNSVASINTFFKNHFNKVPSISEVNSNGIRPEMRDEFLKTHQNLAESLYESEDYSLYQKDLFIQNPNTRETMSAVFQYSGNVYDDYSQLANPKKKDRFIPTATCLPFSRSLFVTVNGKILPCERIGQEFALGYADENKVDLDLEQIADKFNAYYDKMRKLCNHCHNTKTCSQCILKLVDLDEPATTCNGYMREEDFALYLSARLSYLEKNPEIYKKAMKDVKVS